MGVEHQDQTGRRRKERVEGGNTGEITETKGYLKNHMGTLYSGKVLKYLHIQSQSNENHQIIGETESQLDIPGHQIRPIIPGMDFI